MDVNSGRIARHEAASSLNCSKILFIISFNSRKITLGIRCPIVVVLLVVLTEGRRGGGLSFYTIPWANNEETTNRRGRWIRAIRRENWSEKQINNARLCSAHFLKGMLL